MSEKEEIQNSSNVLIVGKKRSGKTVEGMKIAIAKAVHQHKLIYTYRHPNEPLMKAVFGDKYGGNLTDILEFGRSKDAVVLCDEAHIHFTTMEKKVNDKLRAILGLSTQRNVDVILITHSFQFLNESLMANYIDVVIIKELHDGHWETDRRYAKKLYGDVYVKSKDEVYVHLVNLGVKRYIKSTLPKWWKEEYSHAYKTGATSDLNDLF